MKLWRRALGAMKGRKSVWMTALSRRRSKHDNRELEEAVIRATSHDEDLCDYKNTHRVFNWVRASPVHLLPFIRALSRRLSRTRNSVVAIKGLMLLHGVLCTKIPASCSIGRLPFDLSSFSDLSSKSSSLRYALNAFIRSYYSFLDQKSVLISIEFQSRIARPREKAALDDDGDDSSKDEMNCPIALQLLKVKKWQGLLDMLLAIKPRGEVMMKQVVVLEAMDCVIIEVFDVCSKIYDGIANALVRVYAAGEKAEASMALGILYRATKQAEELEEYLDLCRGIGVVNASECPRVERFPEEDVIELERMIQGVSAGNQRDKCRDEEKLAIVGVREENERGRRERERASAAAVEEVVDKGRRRMATVITDKWEVFDDDDRSRNIGNLIDLSDEGDDGSDFELYAWSLRTGC